MKTLDTWRERDLTADARAGKLNPAFEIDETVSEIGEMLEAGYCPIVTGESGVGRTAAVHELVRRVTAGAGPACLDRRRVVEVSLMRKAATLENRYELAGHLQKHADKNGLLVSEMTLKALPDGLPFEPAGELEKEGIPTYRLMGSLE